MSPTRASVRITSQRYALDVDNSCPNEGSRSEVKDEHGRSVSGVGRLVGFSAVTSIAGVAALLYGAGRGGAHGAVSVVLGILIVASDLALWVAVAVTQWKRRDLEPGENTPAERPQNRPAWLDSTGSVVVLFAAAGMWAYFTAAAVAKSAYVVAGLQAVLFTCTVWTITRILRRRRERRS